MFRSSRGPDPFLHIHPWAYRHLYPLSDDELVGLFNAIADSMSGNIFADLLRPVWGETNDRILRILEQRGSNTMGIFPGSSFGSVGTFPRMSSSLSITQTAPMPNVTIQAIPAPQQNINFQPGFVPQQNITFVPPPAPAPQPPPAALPDIHYVTVYGPYGNVIGTRLETEKEKDDREYAVWKAEHGAK